MNSAHLTLAILVIISMLAVDIHFSSSYEEYSMYNSNWNGTSMFISYAIDSGAELIENYDALNGIKNSTLIIIEPDGDFSPDELRNIRDYRTNGNKIFISDETGSSEILLLLLDDSISVTKGNLSGIDIEYQNPRFLICYASAIDPLLTGVNSIVLNKPSIAKGDNVLASTSFISWIDENGNGKADGRESLGKRPVLVKAGNIYLLSDSGIFQNSIYREKNLRDNRQFIENLLKSSENVYIGYRHSGIESKEEPLELITFLRQNEMIKATTIIIIIILLLLFYRGKNDRN